MLVWGCFSHWYFHCLSPQNTELAVPHQPLPMRSTDCLFVLLEGNKGLQKSRRWKISLVPPGSATFGLHLQNKLDVMGKYFLVIYTWVKWPCCVFRTGFMASLGLWCGPQWHHSFLPGLRAQVQLQKWLSPKCREYNHSPGLNSESL